MSVLLIVQGTPTPKTLDATRTLHNETAGSAPGIAAARSLGDLSHNVYTQLQGGSDVMFMDRWVDAQGIMSFFSNPEVQAQGGKLFSARDATIWMPAVGSFSYTLPAPQSARERHVGIVRGKIKNAEEAIGIFAKVDQAAQRDARRRGLMSHEIFIKIGAPGDALELLGLDIWFNAKGMGEHYSDATHMSALGGAFVAKPDSGVWTQAAGDWSEW